MTVQGCFDWLSEHLERVLSTWWGALLYFAILSFAALPWGWDGLDRAIYISGAIVIILLIGCGRRDNKAIHAKLDVLTPDDTLNRLEERSEAEIEEARS